MTKKGFILLTILTVLAASTGSMTAAEVSNDRMNRSFEVFSSGIDKLLLDTAHVFVNISEEVHGVYLEDTGAIFIGDISITGTANVSIMVKDWKKWFTNPDTKDSSSESDEKQETNKKKEYRKLENSDQERLENMGEHITAFKQELTTMIMDFGLILKGLDDQDRVTVILFVKDKEFLETYKTRTITVDIPFGKLKKLDGKSPTDPRVQKEFRFNI